MTAVTYKPISGLTALAEASIKGDDYAVVVDVHDTTQAPTGSTKKITLADLRTALLAGSNGAFTDDAVFKLNGQSYTFPASQVASGFLQTDGAGNLSWVSEHSAISLAQLTDVSLTSPSSGQWLGYSGGLWVNHTPVFADITDRTTAATGITKLGVVNTGTWQAAVVATTYGGTGLASWTAGDVPYYAAGALLSKLPIGGVDAVFTSSGTAPQWSTHLAYSTLPSGGGIWAMGGDLSVTGGLILLGYAARLTMGSIQGTLQTYETDAVGGVTTARWSANVNAPHMVLAKSRSAVVGTPGVAVQSGDHLGNIVFAGDDGSDLNTRGVFIEAQVTGAVSANRIPSRLVVAIAAGSADDDVAEVYWLTPTVFSPAVSGAVDLGSTTNKWGALHLAGDIAAANAVLTGSLQLGTALAPNYGGTGLTSYTIGDLLYASGATTLAKLGIGTANKVFTSSGSAPQWSANIVYAALPTGNGSWDTGVGTTITVTRSLTVSGTLTGTLTGNASTATALQTPRTIGGVNFDGTAPITVASATAGFTVSGGDLALGANNLTLTGSIGSTGARSLKGWFTDLQVTNAISGSVTGNAATATALATARAINGVSFDGTAPITVTAAAGTLSGATLASGVTASSLTSLGTLAADLLFTDAAYDVGKTNATRPRDGFFSRNVAAAALLAGLATRVSAGIVDGSIQAAETGAGGGIAVVRWSADVNAGHIVLAKSRSTTVGTPGTAVQSGDHLGNLVYAGDDGTDLNTRAAFLEAQVTGAVSTNRIPAKMVLSIAAGSADDDIAEVVGWTPTAYTPATASAITLGTALLPWGNAYVGNVFLGSTKAIDFGAGNITITHSTGALTFIGDLLFGQAGGTGRHLAGSTSIVVSGLESRYQAHGTDAALGGFSGTRWSANGNPVAFVMGKSRSGTIGAYSALQSGDSIGQLRWAGDDGTDLGTTAARITGAVAGAVAGNRVPGMILFETAAGSADDDVTEKWRIGSDGTLQAIGAVSVRTATGTLTLASGGGNGDVLLSPNGTGVVKFGSFSALSGETLAGYITIKDAGGTSRKVAIIA